MKKSETMKVRNIPLELIDRPAESDRLSIDPEHIKDLAASITEVGLISPVILCLRGGRYEIVSGDCRYQAFLSLGRTEIPAFVQDLSDAAISITRATENLQRRDLTPIEEARIYKNLHTNFAMSWDDIAKKTGKSAGLIKRRYDLLKMPQILIDAIHARKIGYAVAEELMSLNYIAKIDYYLGFCVDHGATKEVVREWVKEEKARERQHDVASAASSWGSALPVLKPVYISCDLCSGPSMISETVSIRICKTCYATIKEHI